LYPRSTIDGVAGLVGNPARRFPGLVSTTATLDMAVSVNRYIQERFVVDIGPFNVGAGDPADYPDYFAGADLQDVPLHRSASTISGRCAQSTGLTRSVDNALIRIEQLWHRFPAADIDPFRPGVVENPNVVSLPSGLYSERLSGLDRIRQRTLTPLAGEEKTLVRAVAAGDHDLFLSDRINLVAGSIVTINPGHADLAEFIEVASVAGASTADQPAIATLQYPVLHEHRDHTTVVRVSPQAPGTSNNLVRDAIAGDQTVFLDGLVDLTDSTVEVFGAGTPEYHRARLYEVHSDLDGFFSFPPLSRVSQMLVSATHVDHALPLQVLFSPNYELFDNRLDLIFG
jgi:hypothetical protein